MSCFTSGSFPKVQEHCNSLGCFAPLVGHAWWHEGGSLVECFWTEVSERQEQEQEQEQEKGEREKRVNKGEQGEEGRNGEEGGK